MQFELIGCHSLNVWGKKMQSPIRQCQQQISVSRRSLVSNKERGPRFPFPLLLLPAIWSQHRKPAILLHPPYVYLREERSVCIEWSRIITKEIQVHASLDQFLSSAVAIKIRCDDIYLLFFSTRLLLIRTYRVVPFLGLRVLSCLGCPCVRFPKHRNPIRMRQARPPSGYPDLREWTRNKSKCEAKPLALYLSLIWSAVASRNSVTSHVEYIRDRV